LHRRLWHSEGYILRKKLKNQYSFLSNCLAENKKIIPKIIKGIIVPSNRLINSKLYALALKEVAKLRTTTSLNPIALGVSENIELNEINRERYTADKKFSFIEKAEKSRNI
jgi:hypothetical protein